MFRTSGRRSPLGLGLQVPQPIHERVERFLERSAEEAGYEHERRKLGAVPKHRP
jgi:hypothetical protein